jgi:hypothetical protein
MFLTALLLGQMTTLLLAQVSSSSSSSLRLPYGISALCDNPCGGGSSSNS